MRFENPPSGMFVKSHMDIHWKLTSMWLLRTNTQNHPCEQAYAISLQACAISRRWVWSERSSLMLERPGWAETRRRMFKK